MALNNSQTIDLDNKLWKDIEKFCKLNNIENMEQFFHDCFIKGYHIEKNGLLNSSEPQIIEKEIIKRIEVPVEVIKEVTVDKIIEKEIIKEVEKIVEVEDTKRVDELLLKIQQLETNLKRKPKSITKEVEKPVEVEVIKEVYITDDEQVNKLSTKLDKLEVEKKELLKKIGNLYKKEIRYDTEISEYVRKISELKSKPPVEIIKVVERIITKGSDTDKMKMLQETIQSLQKELREKKEIILLLENNVLELKKMIGEPKAKITTSSNLNDNLYK